MNIKNNIVNDVYEKVLKLNEIGYSYSDKEQFSIVDMDNYYKVLFNDSKKNKIDFIYDKKGNMIFCVPHFSGIMQCIGKNDIFIIRGIDNNPVCKHFKYVDGKFQLVNMIYNINSLLDDNLSVSGVSVKSNNLLKGTDTEGYNFIYNYYNASFITKDYDDVYRGFLANCDKFGCFSDNYIRVVKKTGNDNKKVFLEYLIDDDGNLLTPICDFINNKFYLNKDNKEQCLFIDSVINSVNNVKNVKKLINK